MAITKKRKRELVESYAELLSRSHGVILTDNLGLNVAEMTELRRQISEAGGECHVTKNRLTHLALSKAGLPEMDKILIGPTLTSFAVEDLPQVAKVIVNFAKDNDLLTIKGGLMDQQVLDREEVKVLAELPPLPVQRSQLLGLINTPATSIAGALSGGIRQVLTILKARTNSETSETAA